MAKASLTARGHTDLVTNGRQPRLKQVSVAREPRNCLAQGSEHRFPV